MSLSIYLFCNSEPGKDQELDSHKKKKKVKQQQQQPNKKHQAKSKVFRREYIPWIISTYK